MKNEVLSKFEKSLSGSKYKLGKNDFNRNYRIQIDGLITTEEGYPYCVICVKSNLYGSFIRYTKNRVLALVNTIQARFAVITDGEKYLFFDTSKENAVFEKLEYDEIIQNLKNEQITDAIITSKNTQ